MAKLVIKTPEGEENAHELKDDVTSIGRSSTNIIQIKDEQASREHCRIIKDGDSFRVEDLKSRNGILVNGVKVEQQTLKVGDVLKVGEHRFVFDQEVEVSAEELGATVSVSTLSEDELKSKQAPAAAPDAPPKYVLLVTGGPDKGAQVLVGEAKITIGRHSANTLPLQDEASSNYHAEVEKETIGFVITDLGSTNGTKVNGEKIVKSPLAHGAEITIGQTTIIFKDVNRQVDEDQVFGTVVLDTEQLEKELSEAGTGGPSFVGPVAAALVALAVLAGLGYGVYRGVRALFA
ncbi:MAG TPA: FHA domain-containing protein, partial [Planctomycetes bacterium]|nr:FHA domain-containing protein [Planctomycetota bacterium]